MKVDSCFVLCWLENNENIEDIGCLFAVGKGGKHWAGGEAFKKDEKAILQIHIKNWRPYVEVIFV